MLTRPDRNAGPEPVGPRSPKPCDDDGMATAEFAVVLPAIVLTLLIGLGAVSTMTMRMRCADAAAMAARLAARGETAATVVAAARRAAPTGAVVELSTVGGAVRVTVRATAHVLPVTTLIPGFAVTGSFVEAREPGPPP